MASATRLLVAANTPQYSRVVFQTDAGGIVPTLSRQPTRVLCQPAIVSGAGTTVVRAPVAHEQDAVASLRPVQVKRVLHSKAYLK